MRKGEEDQEGNEDDERVQMALHMGAGGSYSQAMADPEADEATEEKKKGMRRPRWADTDDNEEEGRQEEEEERAEQEKMERQSVQEEVTDEKPPGFGSERGKRAQGGR